MLFGTMVTKDCDILVVGAGPAGSSAALAAAGAGAKVLVAERREQIGVPVRCAEYIPRALLGELPFRDRSFVVQQVNCMRTVLPEGQIKETKTPGLIIQRDLFDQRFAECARTKGAEICRGLRAVARKNGEVFLKDARSETVTTRPLVIIGADGPHSTVGKWSGLRPRRFVPGIQFRVPLAAPMEHTEVHFHPRIFGAYGWLFPRGDEANVGLALAGGTPFHRSLKSTLEWFLGRLERRGQIGTGSRKLMFGWIPVEPLESVVSGNTMLAGDAAGHTHPVSGAGVAHAVLAGRLAGKWAVEGVQGEDLSVLERYDDEVRGELGETLKRGARRRRLLEDNWDRLTDTLPFCWVAFREYYQDAPPWSGADLGNNASEKGKALEK